ncbi:MAG: triose-phosphate isomerase [Chloroflexota bacterium]|nr:triose-phosphate isomerase [Chloroflexota bacterium]
MRDVLIVANWKMNTTPADAAALARAIAAATVEPLVQRVICPPFVSLAAVAQALAGTDVGVGAQNVHAEVSGAYTGEIAAPMLAGLASWCLVGHSERRRDQAETDELIGRKLLRCREAGLRPILCVGERLDEREAGRAEETVRRQLERAMAVAAGGEVIDPDVVIAYEPVWAIGTGRSARGADAAAMAETIRESCAELGMFDAEHLTVLYGGSVTSSSIGEFLAEPSIDGALVGGASLKVDEMAGIVARAALTARARADAGSG